MVFVFNFKGHYRGLDILKQQESSEMFQVFLWVATKFFYLLNLKVIDW